MAVTPQIIAAGIRALQRDLVAMVPDARMELTSVIAWAVEPIAARARARMPLGDGRASAGSGAAHIRDTIKGSAAGTVGRVGSRHPGAKPHEFGLTIAPKGAPITMPKREMIYGAVRELRPVVIARMDRGITRLAHRHGFHG